MIFIHVVQFKDVKMQINQLDGNTINVVDILKLMTKVILDVLNVMLKEKLLIGNLVVNHMIFKNLIFKN
jgi:hypothetical protein